MSHEQKRKEPFIFIIPVYNAERYIGKCLDSVLAQSNPNWGAVVVDDCSTDRTLQIIREKVAEDSRFTIIANTERRLALYNIDQAITDFCHDPNSIIGILDGDDWLAHDQVVVRSLEVHQHYDVVWSQCKAYPSGYLGVSNHYPPRADIRLHPWVCSHFRTFKKYLFDLIDKKDFQDQDGTYFSMTYDQAVMLPILEMAGPKKRYFLDEVQYIYNRENPLNDDKIDRAAQSAVAERIRILPPYDCLYPCTEDELAEMTRTNWEQYGTPDGVLDVFDPTAVELSFGMWNPRPGEFVGARQVLPAHRGKCYHLRVEVHDRCNPDKYPGRIEQRVYVDGKIIWKHDISSDLFAGWNTVETDIEARTDQIEVRIEVWAVGEVGIGGTWWAQVSRTAIRNLYLEAIDDRLNASQTPIAVLLSRGLGQRILIAGSYGMGNTGDEAILGVILNQLRSRLPDAYLQVVAGDVDDVRTQFGVQTVVWDDWADIVAAVKQADLMILGGGGMFFDYQGFDPRSLLENAAPDLAHYGSFPLLAGLFGKPLMIYAVGVEPLLSEEAREVVRLSFSLAHRATVRDAESKALLQEIGVDVSQVQVTADPAFCMQVSDAQRARDILIEHQISPDRPIIGLVPRPWNNGISQAVRETQLTKTIASFAAQTKAQVLLIPFHKGYDDATLDRFQRNLQQHLSVTDVRRLRGGFSPPDIAAVIGSCNLLVGLRLHSILFSILTGTPAVALNYAPKVRSLTRMVGHEEICLDLTELSYLENLLARVWEKRDELIQDFIQTRGKLKVLGESNIDLACTLVGSPVPDLASGETFRKILAQVVESRLQAIRVRDYTIQMLQSRANTAWQEVLRTHNRFIHDLQGLTGSPAKPVTSQSSASATPMNYINELHRFLQMHVHEETKYLVLIFAGASLEGTDEPRAIGLAQAFSRLGAPVIYVRWDGEPLAEMVLLEPGAKHVFHLPAEILAAYPEAILDNLSRSVPPICRRIMLIEFPHPDLFRFVNLANANGWITIYESTRSWETASRATWYDRAFEQYLVLNTELHTATTEALCERLMLLGAKVPTLLSGALAADSNGPHNDWHNQVASLLALIQGLDNGGPISQPGKEIRNR